QEELHNNIIDRGLKKVCEANLMRAEKVAEELEWPVTTTVLVGKPFAKVLDYVVEKEPELLVVGRYGAHHVEGADMGSQAHNLLRLAPCNILLVGATSAKPYDIPVIEEYEEEPLEWDDEAIKLILRAPPFAQSMAKASVEEFAREHGHERVTMTFLQEALRGVLPASARHLMGLEYQDRRIIGAREAARSPIEEFAPHESNFRWTEGARRRVNERVPAFVRPIAMLSIERYAREKGLVEIDEELCKKVARQLGYEPDGDGPVSPLHWTEEGEKRLARVPAFERAMVKEMVESMARADGHSEIDFEIADQMLAKIRSYYEAAMAGGSSFFADMAEMKRRVEEEARKDGYEV
ncbi:MAG: universal stress protein, partial [Ardenticatenaceae bacterium]